jgi:hypothetical protein
VATLNDLFDVVRHDLINRRGGGVCLFIRKHVNFCEICKPESLELVVIDIFIGGQKYRLVSIYRPPDIGSKGVGYMSALTDYYHSERGHMARDSNR